MLTSRARDAVTRLTGSLLAVRPLAEALAGPVRVAPPPGTWPAGLVEHIARRAGVPGLTAPAGLGPGDLQVFERVISDRLATLPLPAGTVAGPEVDAVVDEAVANGFDAVFHRERLLSHDGVPLYAYASAPAAEAVVFVPACGMPAALTENWLRHLARDRQVLTWESRGLDPSGPAGDHAVDTAAQARDLFTVMDRHGVGTAHVVGLCGGAVIALAAAAGRPERIASLSLWHGAYEFADGSDRTKFQNDLIELMVIAARSRPAARSVQAAFCQVALTSTPAEIAHFVLYPYASAELFYRYCALNGALALTDVSDYLPRVHQPTLVVTSADDATAHPEGSRRVAGGLRHGRLRVEPHGDHASLFQADDALIRVATDFMAGVSSNRGTPA
ncbi:alpha/beta hydrolase [Actinoplanes sp. NPDC049316]|uniref:alpha/beta fold hydrolase n=1 Tax=Actinoplanes sp. NPDC049316 TaxID=3154727 RepID=UPI0034346E1C